MCIRDREQAEQRENALQKRTEAFAALYELGCATIEAAKSLLQSILQRINMCIRDSYRPFRFFIAMSMSETECVDLLLHFFQRQFMVITHAPVSYTHLNQTQYRALWAEIMGKMKMQHTPHECRHTFRSRLDSAGANKVDVYKRQQSADLLLIAPNP